MREIVVRRAVPADAARLTALAHRAKAHWGYPPAWLAEWADALTIVPDYIERHRVFVAEQAEELLGVCAIEDHETHWSLEHVWVDPLSHGRHIGRRLVDQALAAAAAKRPGLVRVESDPHAVDFYLRLGARLAGTVKAPMEGAPERILPVLEFSVPPPAG